VELVPGARAALESAAAVALVTNGPERRQRIKLETLGILDRFDAVVYADDLARRKPHALPFERALDGLGVRPDRALFVGNSLGYDVAGAQNAGIPVVWVRGEDDPGAYEPEYVVDSLTELPALLAGER